MEKDKKLDNKKNKPFLTWAMFDTFDSITNELITESELVWFFPETKDSIKESTYENLEVKEEQRRILDAKEYELVSNLNKWDQAKYLINQEKKRKAMIRKQKKMQNELFEVERQMTIYDVPGYNNFHL